MPAFCAAIEVRTSYPGLPSPDVRAVAVTESGVVYAATAGGLARLAGNHWTVVDSKPVGLVAARDREAIFTAGGALWETGGKRIAALPPGSVRGLAAGWLATEDGLFRLSGERFVRVGSERDIRAIAVGPSGQVAVAAGAGLFLYDGAWRALYPHEGNRSWAPRDVRAVTSDARGRLWFASPHGAGCREGDAWKLFTGAEGLPYNDFTAVAAGKDGAVWFGTRLGAIRFDGANWEYRQGQRWLPDDDVRGIAITAGGDAWFATAGGAAAIERRPMSLAEKARFYESEIDQRHRRTPYGYVLEVSLKKPGDKTDWVQHDSDNDGLWTSMYGAGECFAWAAKRDPAAKRRAKAAFEALRFLSQVTQGGPHPAPRGFVARSILPASGRDPNAADSRERDERTRATRDRLWKVIVPRWPLSADGQWYWKCDTSSDELDGHYFFYALYYDLVADTAEEKQRVREHVAALTDHLVEHDFQLVDHDGQPTRWGMFNPAKLNHDPLWRWERGLNSLSILSYLKVAGHVTGEAKYEEAARRLIRDHGYAANALIPKTNAGPGSGNQSDDEMAFMDFYHLVRYETDPVLRQGYALALYQYWRMEEPELNPLFNFIYAAGCEGIQVTSPFGAIDVSARGAWLAESLDTLQRFPLDLVSWRLTNSQRLDIVPLPAYTRDDGTARRGHRRNGRVLPVDERFVVHWNQDPWQLDQGGDGRALADGSSFLLPYYMGLYHKFVRE